MIRNVILHLQGEQPLFADLEALPDATTATLLCHNLRTTNGKTPTFVTNPAAVFLIPMVRIFFIEISPESLASRVAPDPGSNVADNGRLLLSAPASEPEVPLDAFSRRVRDA